MRSFRRRAAGVSVAALLIPTVGCQGFSFTKPKAPAQQSSTPHPEIVQQPAPLTRPATDAAPPPQETVAVADDPQAQAIQQYIERIAAASSGGAGETDGRAVVLGPAAQRPPASAVPTAELTDASTAAVRVGGAPSACPTPASGSAKVRTLPWDVPLGDEGGSVSLASSEYTATIVEPGRPAGYEATPAPGAAAAPPRIKQVQVRAAGSKASPAASARSASDNVASINRPVETSQIPTSLKGFLDQYMRDHGAGDQRAQLEERVLRVLVGDYAGARAPLTMATNEQQQLTRSIVEALISARAAHPGDAGAMSNAATQALNEMASALRAMDELRIPAVAICWKVEGFGRYEEFSPAKFVAGRENEVIVYCELTGFSSEPDGSRGFKTEFDVVSSIIDRAGNVVQKYAAEGIVDRCRTRRTDCFVPHLIRLPATLAPGEYTVKVTITDKLGGKVAENRAKFTMVTSL
jgi:hypothetical protein